MPKLPAFQFYPADWRSDNGVQSLSYFERGVWFEILCLMHESEQRGKLLLNGKPMPDEALARLLGLDKQILTKALATILEYGVATRLDDGTLVNRRMIRDEELRQIRKEVGKLGGNPVLVNQNSTKPEKEVNQNSTPSITPSSSSSTTSSPSVNTHTAKSVSVANGNKSSFSFEECLKYATTQKGINNPQGLATVLYRTGEADALIQETLYPTEKVKTETVDKRQTALEMLLEVQSEGGDINEYRQWYEEDWKWLIEQLNKQSATN
jgi:hypothetical protein